MSSCPEPVVAHAPRAEPLAENFNIRALILYHNGFGFQYNEKSKEFYLCFCKDFSDEEVQKIKLKSGSNSLRCGDWIGNSYLAINWVEYSLIEKILTSVLELGYSFVPINELGVRFDPKDDVFFTYEVLEEKFIATWDEFGKVFGIEQKFRILDEWNWKTNLGKSFCRHLRKGKPYTEKELQLNYLTWPIFQNYDPKTLLDLPGIGSPNETNLNSRTPDNIEKYEPEKLCLICLERPPTLVFFPCEHVVVCRQCFDQMENYQGFKEKCIKCRSEIKTVI